MASKIAPLRPLPPPPPDTSHLCDRCVATLAPMGTTDLARLRLRGRRILVDKVAPVGAAMVERVSEHLFAPAQSARGRQVYGIIAHVLAIGPEIDPVDIAPGDRVIIDEFAGRPLWWDDRTLPYWVVGDSEVMIALGAVSPRITAP